MAQVFETANNNTIATATNLGNIRNSPFVKGDLFGTDSADFFKFQVDRATKGGIAVVPQGIDANLVLFNSSGQQIRNSLKPGTATEGISFDNLPTGEYTVLVSKSTGSGSYTLSANGSAINRAQMSVTVNQVKALERYDTPVPFTNFARADFYIETKIDGQSKTSRVFGNDDDISPNFTFTKEVDINKPLINARIGVKDEDPDTDDIADINVVQGFEALEFNYDVFNDKGTGFGVNSIREGQVVISEGDGEPLFDIIGPIDEHAGARITYRIQYDTFAPFTSFSNNTPLILGTNASQNLTGQNQGGILCGEGGNDKLSGMGGNDALCGGTGNDIQSGGTGNDISFGGLGRDTHTGGTGNDTFVLALNNDVDTVKDFQNGRDKLGLSMELNPEILDIVQQGRNTVIGVGGERLATLLNVRANQINAADFVTVDFSRFKGIEVPTLVS
jgi:Ca2+-binding RTX toxin-like protein